MLYYYYVQQVFALMLIINMQETVELFAEFQISFKILEKLPERNSELMGMIKHITYIHKYIDEYIDVLGIATTQTDQTGNLVI